MGIGRGQRWPIRRLWEVGFLIGRCRGLRLRRGKEWKGRREQGNVMDGRIDLSLHVDDNCRKTGKQ